MKIEENKKILSIDPATNTGYCINGECFEINWKKALGELKDITKTALTNKDVHVIQSMVINKILKLNPTEIQYEKTGSIRGFGNNLFQMFHYTFDSFETFKQVKVRNVNNIRLNHWIKNKYGEGYIKTDKRDAHSVYEYFEELDNA